MTVLVPLHRRSGPPERFALIDAADAEAVLAYRWFFDGKYPATRIADRKGVRLHAFLMGRKPGDEGDVDHINRQPLDNRRSNLRVVSHAKNSRNRGSWDNATSAHRGVCWDPERRKWKAQAKHNYQQNFLGRFDTEEAAAAAVARFWQQVESQDESYLYDQLLKEKA